MVAPARVLRHEPPRPHLALVDNVSVGENIVAAAQKRQQDLLEQPAPEHQVIPVNRNRKRTVKPRAPRNGPVVVTPPPLAQVNPVAVGIAMLIAGNDTRRIKIIDNSTVLVVNHPQTR